MTTSALAPMTTPLPKSPLLLPSVATRWCWKIPRVPRVHTVAAQVVPAAAVLATVTPTATAPLQAMEPYHVTTHTPTLGRNKKKGTRRPRCRPPHPPRMRTLAHTCPTCWRCLSPTPRLHSVPSCGHWPGCIPFLGPTRTRVRLPLRLDKQCVSVGCQMHGGFVYRLLFCLVLSCLVLSCLVLSCLVLSCLVLSCPACVHACASCYPCLCQLTCRVSCPFLFFVGVLRRGCVVCPWCRQRCSWMWSSKLQTPSLPRHD